MNRCGVQIRTIEPSYIIGDYVFDTVKKTLTIDNVETKLNNKLNANVILDLRSAIDPLGDEYASTIANLQKNGTLGANQAAWLLQQANYLPDDMPEKEQPKVQVQPVQMVSSDDKQSTEGGDSDDQD